MSDPLRHKVAVVTGASRGIGRAIAQSLAEAGAAVALVARDSAALDRVTGELVDAGHPASLLLPVATDVADRIAVDRAVAKICEHLGPVDILVNNAGDLVRKPLADTTDDDWRRVIAVNLDGPFYFTRALVKDLVARRGRVINIASISGHQGTPLLAAYCAAKHGLIGLTRALAEELRSAGVTVNAVCPGSVDTQMLRRGLPGVAPEMSPTDVAAVVLFLATGSPPAITGSCIDLFG